MVQPVNKTQEEVVSSNIKKALSTMRQDLPLKNGARVKPATKSDLIRSYAQQQMTASQIKTALQQRGFGVYYSEIYRAISATTIALKKEEVSQSQNISVNA